ncbi:histone deacetylase 6-like isoform X2 [Pollicipes pollicipes]|uniref:histone deacetylase 6-like isoform X2 n=1 Tax=Pollicipes pollicipes TaxID=41117 RepID=UPI0018851AFD|nr:histone deacetylase 6-like isoform X2 [Pollicipes pollicipes]
MSQCAHSADVQPVPAGGIDASAACQECDHKDENWLCLHCYKVLCSRFAKEHMIKHSTEANHHVVLSLADLSTWCYGCDSYVDNDKTQAAKDAAHANKFGK